MCIRDSLWIMQRVAPGSTVIRDEWTAYRNIERNFMYKTINRSMNFVDLHTLAQTQSIETIWTEVYDKKKKKQWGTHCIVVKSYFLLICTYKNSESFIEKADYLIPFYKIAEHNHFNVMFLIIYY